ncbi:CdaR family transcriptional regulator [Planococcus shixiaomingii]|uniref:CdaR family transcriptional regulator n=1 Tax=Planococcus shixiaomingii TaxID=3058393 RepID=UPI0026129C54|nr:sugar diacid recognition domain-containing protein [Planococcus sp. N022]WKA55533.1 sugar diacid recognition domain-containing protein [Planococcus sp. N022]
MITKQLAEEIVEQTMIRLNRNLNVMDTNGIILASGETERIEKIHEGAAQVAKTGETLSIAEDDLTEWQGVKPGVNMPIYFQGKLVGVIGITGNPEELKEISTLVQLTTEMMVHQSLITSHIEWNRKRNELIFEELTSGKPLSAAVHERISQMGLDGKISYTTLLIELKKTPSPSQRIVEQVEGHFHGQTVVAGHSQLNEIFLLAANEKPAELEKKLYTLLHFLQKTAPGRIGVGVAVNSIFDVRTSYLAARNALEFGKPDQQLIYFEDVELMALLKRNPQDDLAKFTGRILTGLNEPLCQTLTLYFACNKNHAETAAQLMIHRHTLSYRLKKIKDITGLDPSEFQDAVVLHLALTIRK